MKKRNRGRVFLRWFLSYLLILIPPIAAGFIVYQGTLEADRAQARRLNQALARVVINEMDNQLDQVNSYLDQLAFDPDIRMLSNTWKDFDGAEQYRLTILYRNLKNSYLLKQGCDDIFIYFKNNRHVLSTNGVMKYDQYYEIYGKSCSYSSRELEEYLSQVHYQDVLPIEMNGERCLIFSMTGMNLGAEEAAPIMAVRMKLKALERIFESAKWNPDVQLVIMDQGGQVISSTISAGSAVDTIEKTRTEDDGSRAGLVAVGGTEYISTCLTSPRRNWSYYVLVPRQVVDYNAIQIQKRCTVCLIVSIVLGLVLAYAVSMVNYHPLRLLVELFKKQNDMPEVEENEFQWLSRRAEQFFREFKYAKDRLQENSRQLKQFDLIQLLEYPSNMLKKQQTLSRYRIQMDAPYHVVLLIEVDSKGLLRDDSELYFKENALRKFIVTNIFDEMLAEHYLAELVELGERAAVIISLYDREASAETLKSIIENAQQLIEDKFDFTPVVLMGGIEPGADGIHTSYLQASESAGYAGLLEADFIIYDEVKNAQKKYCYSIETEQKIINAIKAGNEAIACSTMLQVLDDNISGEISIGMYHCLVCELVGTMLKAADESGCADVIEKIEKTDYAALLSEHMSAGELRETFQSLTGQICSSILKQKQEAEKQGTFREDIDAYIEANFRDPDLNISLLGQHFNITPAYLASLYKKEAGKSPLEYINTLRIDAAEILLQQGKSVTAAAAEVGFRDSGALIRVFKKKKGITPGQVKQFSKK